MMKKLILLAAVLCMAACSGSAPETALLGMQAPDTRFTMMDGETVLLGDMRGHPAVVIFWATHCNKSQREIRKLNSLTHAPGMKSRGVAFVAVSVDKLEKQELLNQRIQSDELTGLKHAFSGNDVSDEAYQAFDVGTLPTIIVIDPAGKIIYRGTEADEAAEALQVLNAAAVPSARFSSSR